jgi:prevent-host-death family protein
VGHAWRVDEAQRNFADLIDRAAAEGPQTIRRRGEDVAVVVSIEDWQAMQPSLRECLLDPRARTEQLVPDDLPEIRVKGLQPEDF